jgi:hypothetical protein
MMSTSARWMTALFTAALAAGACGTNKDEGGKIHGGISPQRMTDAVYAVIAADRLVYTREIVNRLTLAKVIKATEHFKDEQTLALPAQMLRMGAETVQKGDHGFTYALLSLWPINKQNAAKTKLETDGLKAVAESGKPFYGEEELGGKRYFTAVYADNAVSEACVTCHNDNADSPRSDFKLGDVMGGVVVRIALQ